MVFDENLEVLSRGRTLARRHPDAVGRHLSELIVPLRWRGELTLETIHAKRGKLLQFQLADDSTDPMQFKGEVTQVDDGRWFLIATPKIHETEKVREIGLTFQDFARFDTTIDNLFLLQAAKQSSLEAEQTARRLRDSEERYRLIVEHDQYMVLSFDVDGIIDFANSTWSRFAGGTAVGASLFDYVDPDSRARLQSMLVSTETGAAQHDEDLSRTEELAPEQDRDLELLGAGGASITVEGSFGRFERQDGRVTLFAIFVDVSEARRASRAIEEARDRVIRAQKMDAIGRLAGGIAHDFNNLLGVSMTAASIILEDLPTGDPLREDAEMILSSCEEGARLSAQLMSFSRDKRVRPEVMDLSEAVFDLLPVIDSMVGERIQVAFSQDGSGLHVLFDRGELEQVLLYLCSNARDAMPNGGKINISVSSPRQQIVTLSVRDDGHGMSEEVVQRAVEPFFSTRSSGKHSGLGLAVVYGISDRSGADLSISSSPDTGTDVQLAFPRSRAAPPRRRSRSRDIPTRRATLDVDGVSPRVLLVEDRPELREANALSLRRLGCEVVAVEGVNGRRSTSSARTSNLTSW